MLKLKSLSKVFFRFAAGLLLVVLVSMVGVRLEKQTLEMRRAVSLQYYQTDILLEQLVRLRLETQKLTAPAQLALMKQAEENASASARKPTRRATSQPRGAGSLAKRPSKVPQPNRSTAVNEQESTAVPKRPRVANSGQKAFSPDDDDTLHPPLLRVLHPFNPQGLD